MIASLLAAGACVLALAALRFSPRWAHRLAVGGFVALGLFVLAQGGWLAGLLLFALGYGLHAILTDIGRADAAALPPSGQAPGGAHAPGAAGKRDGERHAPSLPDGVSTTAGRAGRPRSFFEGNR